MGLAPIGITVNFDCAHLKRRDCLIINLCTLFVIFSFKILYTELSFWSAPFGFEPTLPRSKWEHATVYTLMPNSEHLIIRYCTDSIE